MEVDLATIDLGQDRGFGEAGADFGGHSVGRDRSIELFAAAMGLDYGKPGRLIDFWCFGFTFADILDDVARIKVRAWSEWRKYTRATRKPPTAVVVARRSLSSTSL
jgi:hypothetical protein